MSLYTDLQSCKVESDVAIVYNNLFKSQFGITPEQKNNCDSYFYLGGGSLFEWNSNIMKTLIIELA